MLSFGSMGLNKAALLYCLSLSFNLQLLFEEEIVLVNNMNLSTVEVYFGFLSRYFLCVLGREVSDTTPKGKGAIKSL